MRRRHTNHGTCGMDIENAEMVFDQMENKLLSQRWLRMIDTQTYDRTVDRDLREACELALITVSGVMGLTKKLKPHHESIFMTTVGMLKETQHRMRLDAAMRSQ